MFCICLAGIPVTGLSYPKSRREAFLQLTRYRKTISLAVGALAGTDPPALSSNKEELALSGEFA
jgi:hypothetical protein